MATMSYSRQASPDEMAAEIPGVVFRSPIIMRESDQWEPVQPKEPAP